ncbi:MAG: hypothetical protein NPIRA03_17260 [Nitrospirales bacterium]|nr:MAG: hypothetical protein NPIRA03_17260 [Nitrospirales bacterium]
MRSVQGVGEGQKDHQIIIFSQTMLIGLLQAIGFDCQVVYTVVRKRKTPGKLLTKRFGRCDGDGLVIGLVDGWPMTPNTRDKVLFQINW